MKDLIERQAAIDKFEPWLKVSGYSEGELNMLRAILYELRFLPSVQPDNSCDGCRYENADDGVLVPCGFCKRSHSDNYERRTDG